MKKWQKKVAIALCSLAATVSILFGIYVGSQKLLKVTYVTVPLKGLDKRLDGLKILQIADLHANDPEVMNVDIWSKINELDFDVAAITGDFVDRNAYQAESHLEGLSSIASKKPVFFAEGNHDHYSMKKLRPYLEDCGVQVLVDDKTTIEYNGATLDIIGIADYYTADLHISSEMLSNGDNFRLVLVHQPQHIDYVDVSDVPSLILSGHTHGGQLRLPLFPTIYAPGQGFFPKYGYGLYEIDNSKLFVSKGIGVTSKTPVRFWNRPEIVVLTLQTE